MLLLKVHYTQPDPLEHFNSWKNRNIFILNLDSNCFWMTSPVSKLGLARKEVLILRCERSRSIHTVISSLLFLLEWHFLLFLCHSQQLREEEVEEGRWEDGWSVTKTSITPLFLPLSITRIIWHRDLHAVLFLNHSSHYWPNMNHLHLERKLQGAMGCLKTDI